MNVLTTKPQLVTCKASLMIKEADPEITLSVLTVDIMVTVISYSSVVKLGVSVQSPGKPRHWYVMFKESIYYTFN